eukprot:655521-Alexandrium_andersonii.AAC.1
MIQEGCSTRWLRRHANPQLLATLPQPFVGRLPGNEQVPRRIPNASPQQSSPEDAPTQEPVVRS